jgi:hypothetical protein
MYLSCWDYPLRMWGAKSIDIEKTTEKGPEAAHAEISSTVTAPLVRWDYRLISNTADTLIFERHYRPNWTYLAAILLFPIGLIALLHEKSSALTITITETEEGSAIRFRGDVDAKIADAIDSAVI